jgi:protein subunit release factor B
MKRNQKNNKELLYSLTKKDFTIQTFKGSGPGGQHRNKVETAVRIIHKASGATGESKEHKSKLQNQKTAFKRLIESNKFKIWHNRICHELLSGKTLEERVDEAMDEKNLKVDVKQDGKWKRIS